jgi:hypothetical protein
MLPSMDYIQKSMADSVNSLAHNSTVVPEMVSLLDCQLGAELGRSNVATDSSIPLSSCSWPTYQSSQLNDVSYWLDHCFAVRQIVMRRETTSKFGYNRLANIVPM